jgi:hypothetical protein
VSKRPSIQFYPGDWQRDSALRSCSLAARGLWIEMLCLMHDSKPYGHLKIGERNITTELLAMMVGSHVETVEKCLQELELSGVFSRTREGVIYSRRLVKDFKIHEVRTKAGRKGGNPKLVKLNDGVEDIHSVADEDEEEDLDILFETLWSKYPKPLGKKEARRHFDASVKTPEDVAAISVALQNYRVHLANNSTDERFIKHGSTWFNNWREWVDYAPRPTAADGLTSDTAEAEVYSAIERFRQIRGPRPDDGPARQEWDGLFADELGFTPTDWIERTPEQIAAWRDRLTVTQ